MLILGIGITFCIFSHSRQVLRLVNNETPSLSGCPVQSLEPDFGSKRSITTK